MKACTILIISKHREYVELGSSIFFTKKFLVGDLDKYKKTKICFLIEN